MSSISFTSPVRSRTPSPYRNSLPQRPESPMSEQEIIEKNAGYLHSSIPKDLTPRENPNNNGIPYCGYTGFVRSDGLISEIFFTKQAWGRGFVSKSDDKKRAPGVVSFNIHPDGRVEINSGDNPGIDTGLILSRLSQSVELAFFEAGRSRPKPRSVSSSRPPLEGPLYEGPKPYPFWPTRTSSPSHSRGGVGPKTIPAFSGMTSRLDH